MPTDEEKKRVFESLAANGLSFIERAASCAQEDTPASVTHFATGLELLLKARLFLEAWQLVAESPHKANWKKLVSGELKTLNASSLCAALSNATGKKVEGDHAFAQIFRHRNQTLHFYLVDDVVSVVAEHARAWRKLQNLLSRQWIREFAEFSTQILAIEKSMQTNRHYLDAKFEEKRVRLEGLERSGRIATCKACEFPAAVVGQTEGELAKTLCDICTTSSVAVKFRCSRWHVLGDAETFPDCKCGAEHSLDEALALFAGDLPIDFFEDTKGCCCTTCFHATPTVAEINETTMMCLYCLEEFDVSTVNSCVCCNQQWAGFDDDLSEHFGCELCEGKSFVDR